MNEQTAPPEIAQKVREAVAKNQVQNIRIGVSLDKRTGRVILHFDKPVTHLQLDPDGAFEIARQMKKRCKAGQAIRAAAIKEGRDPDMPVEKSRIITPNAPGKLILPR